LHNVTETYTDNAKVEWHFFFWCPWRIFTQMDFVQSIFSSIAHAPTLETLHALILLSWSEYKNNQVAGMWLFDHLAFLMPFQVFGHIPRWPWGWQWTLVSLIRVRFKSIWATEKETAGGLLGQVSSSSTRPQHIIDDSLQHHHDNWFSAHPPYTYINIGYA